MTTQTLIIGSTNVARLRRLRNDLTKEFLVDATVTGTLKNTDGTDVNPDAVDLPMIYVQGSHLADGEYRATIPFTVTLEDGADYVFVVTAIAASGSRRVWNEPCTAILG